MILVGTLAWASSTMPWLDGLMLLVMAALLLVIVLVGLAWWAYQAFGEWWAAVDPNPTPPPHHPIYWPGGKADVAQKAAEAKKERGAA